MTLDAQTRRDFPILERIVNGRPARLPRLRASSQKPRTVIEAMARYYETSHANVHRSIHTLGEEATELYEMARDRVQRFIGTPAREEVVFTRGTTDAISIVAEAIGRTLKPGDEILVTDMEHTRTWCRGRWRRAIAVRESAPSRSWARGRSTSRPSTGS